MNRIILTRLVPLLMMVCLPLSMPAVNTIIYNATYDFGKMTTGTDTLGGVTYTTVNYDGMFNSGEPGMPSLPVDYIKLSVPYNATNFSVMATLQNSFIGNINHLVYPCQPSRMMNDTTPIVIIPPDASVYNSGSYYPSRNAWVVDEGFLAGENHIVTVAVMPVSYRHRALGSVTTNQLRESQTVRIVLSYDLTDTPSMCPIIRQDSTLRQEGYALTRSMVANPDNVMSFAPTQMDMDPLDPNGLITGDGLNGGIEPPDPGNISHDTIAHDGGELEQMTYPYLIVTTPELKHSLRRLAALKRQKGYGVKIVTMDEVMSAPYACMGDSLDVGYVYTDPAGILRQYLRFYFKYYGTKYVLLAGKTIPSRKFWGDPTDYYYRDLSAKWPDMQDLLPELFVGRILANNEADIVNYTDKVFRYELNPGHGNYSYLNRGFFLEGSEFENYLVEMQENLSEAIPYQYKLEENADYPKGADIIDFLNSSHVGFSCIFNHGDTTNIQVFGNKNNGNRSFIYAWKPLNSGNGLNCLDNKYFPLIFYVPACTTMPLDNTINMSLGESFTLGKDYGGPVYIGYTREVYPIPIQGIANAFSHRISNGFHKLGESFAYSMADYTGDFFMETAQLHGYLGDPSIELWTDIPNTLDGISINRFDDYVMISDICTDSVTIVYTDSRNNCNCARTVSSNTILSHASPNGMIMIFKHNYIPFIAPLYLQNHNINHSKYVIANNVEAGNSIDSNRTNGDVIVKSGVNYEIEASGTVTLHDGFQVELGATFAVYPSCF